MKIISNIINHKSYKIDIKVNNDNFINNNKEVSCSTLRSVNGAQKERPDKHTLITVVEKPVIDKKPRQRHFRKINSNW